MSCARGGRRWFVILHFYMLRHLVVLPLWANLLPMAPADARVDSTVTNSLQQHASSAATQLKASDTHASAHIQAAASAATAQLKAAATIAATQLRTTTTAAASWLRATWPHALDTLRKRPWLVAGPFALLLLQSTWALLRRPRLRQAKDADTTRANSSSPSERVPLAFHQVVLDQGVKPRRPKPARAAGAGDAADGSCVSEPMQIVLTGGPLGGKSSLAARLSDALHERGVAVYVAPSVAAMLFNCGCARPDASDAAAILHFEIAVLQLQLQLEASFQRIARASGERRVAIVYDRGVLDVAAYLPRELWGELARQVLLPLSPAPRRASTPLASATTTTTWFAPSPSPPLTAHLSSWRAAGAAGAAADRLLRRHRAHGHRRRHERRRGRVVAGRRLLLRRGARRQPCRGAASRRGDPRGAPRYCIAIRPATWFDPSHTPLRTPCWFDPLLRTTCFALPVATGAELAPKLPACRQLDRLRRQAAPRHRGRPRQARPPGSSDANVTRGTLPCATLHALSAGGFWLFMLRVVRLICIAYFESLSL